MNSDVLVISEHFSLLKTQVEGFPRLPGVYVMRDAEGQVIYVGKAVDLRARVRTYFAGGDGRAQIEFLMRRVAALEKIVTENEQQAFVLERDLIAKYKPRYNIRLKDDKAYLSIKIDQNREWPRIELVRKIEQDGARYFGPYSFSYELRTLVEIIKRVVPLRTCADTVFYNRQRPCLEYQIKRCAGPCCLKVDQDEYQGWVKQAISILEGKTDKLMTELEVSMERASSEMRFEDAATIRDRISILENFKKGQSLTSSRGENRDIFAMYREEGLVVVAVLLMRAGRVSDSKNYSFTNVGIQDEEVIEATIGQFYESGRDIPEEIIVPYELANAEMLLQELKKKCGHALEILFAQRGAKSRLLKLAELNAREHFVATFGAEERYLQVSKRLAQMLSLKQVPRRIECVDISNFQGSDIVGAIVSFFDGNPDKQRYRKFKISQQGKPDDFAAIHEVVSRRLERGKVDGDLPDLFVVDGGPQQLAKALQARNEVGVDLEIVSLAKIRSIEEVGPRFSQLELAKKPERIFREDAAEPVALAEGDEVTHLMQRIRDEVHRFVITFHRSRRSKRVFNSALDDVSGLGPERRGRLLRAFGDIKRMAKASPEEIAKAGRMPITLAHKVLEKIGE